MGKTENVLIFDDVSNRLNISVVLATKISPREDKYSKEKKKKRKINIIRINKRLGIDFISSS